jgi:hypothetical protein
MKIILSIILLVPGFIGVINTQDTAYAYTAKEVLLVLFPAEHSRRKISTQAGTVDSDLSSVSRPAGIILLEIGGVGTGIWFPTVRAIPMAY